MSTFPPIQDLDTTISHIEVLVNTHDIIAERYAIIQGCMPDQTQRLDDPVRLHGFACFLMLQSIFDFGMAQLLHLLASQMVFDATELHTPKASNLQFVEDKLKKLEYVSKLFDSNIWKKIKTLSVVRNTVAHGVGWSDVSWQQEELEFLAQAGFINGTSATLMGPVHSFRLLPNMPNRCAKIYCEAIRLAHQEFSGNYNANP